MDRMVSVEILRDSSVYIARVTDVAGNLTEHKGESVEELLEQVSETLIEVHENALRAGA
jgi:predicted RNase H-like HicB family nuclease